MSLNSPPVSQLLEECCVGPTGSVTMVGSRVGLIPHPENHVHLWSITPEGFIRYTPTSDLVLEVKGESSKPFIENQSFFNITRHIVRVV